MARTAPVPNIPAIPGMNPGIFVMGGGGGGGGGSGKGGSGSGGDQGADGEGGGDDAEGGGGSAGPCGTGGTAGCPGAHNGGGHVAAGDPVDVATGIVYTTPSLEVALPGPLPLVLERFYRSDALGRDVGLGWGWSHSFSWEVRLGRRGIQVLAGDGVKHRLSWLDETLADGPPGWLMQRTDKGFVLDCGDGLRRYFERAAHERRYLLTAVVDINLNTIELTYDDAHRLARITDAVGRVIDVARGADGHIIRFVVRPDASSGHAFFSYRYDTAGRLVEAQDALGYPIVYAYDDRHRMVRQRLRSGLTFHYVYDRAGRCRETWGELPEGEAFLDDDASDLLADRTAAKGIYHCKLVFDDEYVELVDSVSLKRYFTNDRGKVDKAVVDGGVYDRTYDGAGNMTSFTDPTDGRWTYAYDVTGRMTSTTDPLGEFTHYAYDDTGALTRVEHADGSFVVYVRDARGNVISVHNQDGVLIEYRLDPRGMLIEAVMPRGGVTQIQRDAHGNATKIIEPDGATKTLEYDGFGRVTALTDAAGKHYRYQYSARGELVATHIGTATERRTYDAGGRMVTFETVAGLAYHFAWGGLHMLTEARMPDGGTVRHRYNREAWPVRTIDEDGRETINHYDAHGHIARETTYDGREIQYERNAYGALTRFVAASGMATEFEYDARGRLLRRIYDDGTEDQFEWDELGRLLAASNGEVEVSFARNRAGRVERDEQRWNRRAEHVAFVYDAEGRRSEVTSSRGLKVEVTRDREGDVHELALDDDTRAQLHWDGNRLFAGLDVGDARLRRTRNPDGTVAHDALWGHTAPDGAEPERIGEALASAAWFRKLDYKSLEQVSTWVDSQLGQTDFGYDAAGRISERRSPRRDERYAYGLSGDVHAVDPSAPRRTYGPGGRLLTRGDEQFEYDADGQLIARYREADGERVEEWGYTYDAAGRLREVVRPDGHRVENVYDALARRVAQRVYDAENDVVVERRFVWSRDAVAHEVVTRGTTEQVRTYVFDDNDLTLLAMREDEGSTWAFAVPSAQPDVLFDGKARVVSQAETTLWGEATWNGGMRAPVGLPGHYFDEETQLVYNRHRHYDPTLGRYISPDPAGAEGGVHPYAYAESRPHELMDPLGVYAHTTIVDANGNTLATGRSGNPSNRQTHPAVAAAFPQQHGGMNPNGQTGPLGGCGEPNALSNYLYSVERGPPPVNLNPNTHGGRRNIGQALARIPPDGIRTEARGRTGAYPRDQPMAPCPNCSRMLSRMRRMYGGLPANAAAPGYPGAGDSYPQTRDPNAMVRQQGNHPAYNQRARANARRRRNQTRRR